MRTIRGVPMTIADMILYLRQQLLALRSENNRQAVAELLATFKMLTRAAYESGDQELVALMVDLTDSTRDLYMGKPLNGRVPTEEKIRTVAGRHAAVPVAAAATTQTLPQRAEDEPGHEDTQPLDPVAIEEAIKTDEIERQQKVESEEVILKRLHRVALRDWRDHTPIREGSARQMRAYTTVYDDLALFMRLRAHDPMWVGTYPIDLDIVGSDIDIICNPSSLRAFLADVRAAYGDCHEFRLTWKAIQQVPTVIVRFEYNEFLIELFAQPKPVTEQDAYVHMLVEARMLAIGGDEARRVIRELKASGIKTEPAFAAYFGLEGDDPYAQLLALANVSDKMLLELLRKD